MKKKLFSIILSLALMVTMMPAQTLAVSAATKTKTTVSTQKGLKKALKNKKLKTLTVKTAKVKTFKVKKGTHKKVHLVIDAKKSIVKNKSVFKKITIKGIRNDGKKHSFVEYAKNNIIVLETKSVDIGVSKDAKVKEIKVTKKGTNLDLTVNGEVKKISASKNSTIEINGSTEKEIAVKVTNTDANVKVINNTKTTVNATDANGKTQEVKEGETKEIGGNTPSPTPTPQPEKQKTFKAVYNSSDASKTLTFYYDDIDHSGDNITVYDNLPTAATAANDWSYNGIRNSITNAVVDVSVQNYHGLTSTAYMFYSMQHAVSISGAEYLDVSNVTNMSNMFKLYGFSTTSLNIIPNVSSWNTDKVTNMSNMFDSYGYSSTVLNAVPDVNGWNTGNVINMSSMFKSYGYSSTVFNVTPDVSGWNTGKVTDMNSMFSYYGDQSTVLNAVPNVSGWNIDKVTDMNNMFNCYGSSSTTLNNVPNVSGWNTSEVTNMSYMFNQYGENSTVLNAVPNVSGWNIDKVTNISRMFCSYGKSSTALSGAPDVSGWNTANVTNMGYAFKNYGLSSDALNFTLDFSGWSVANVTNYQYMFDYAGASTNTWSVTIPAKTGAQANETTKWYVGDGTDASKYISPASGKSFTLKPIFKAVYNTSGGANTLTFYFDAVDHSGDNITVYDNLPTAATLAYYWSYDGVRDNVKSVVINESVTNYSGLTSTAYMFAGMIKAENISGAQYLNVSNVTNMRSMFNQYGENVAGLTAVPNVSEWDTSKVTVMTDMFRNYGKNSASLGAVPNVSEWNTANVTNMSYMFQGYGYTSTSLDAVPDVSEWNTTNVTNMNYMFINYGYTSTSLTAVPDVSKWKTTNVTNMNYMFQNYGYSSTALNFTLDLSNWDVGKVTDCNNMFSDAGCAATTWSVTIPAKTGSRDNSSNAWYIGDGTSAGAYIVPASGKQFTLAAPDGFVDLGVTNASSEPVYWAKCNLGATSPDSNGDYFAWGETSPYYTTTGGWPTNLTWKPEKEGGYAWQSYCGEGSFTEWSTPPYDSSNKILLPGFDAATVANPDWHTPTAEDFTKLAANCVWEWTTDYNGTGKSGYIVYKAKSDEDKGHANMNGTWKEWDTTQSKFVNNTGSTPSGYILSDVHIFLPVGGFGNGTSLTNKSYAYYWSSTLYSDPSNAFDLVIYSTNINPKIQAKRSNGFNIRPVTE